MASPSSLAVSSITYSDATLSWTNNGSYDQLVIYARKEGDVVYTSASVVGSSSYSLSTLMGTVVEGRGYDWYLFAEEGVNQYTPVGPDFDTVLRAPVATTTTVVAPGEVQVDWTCDAGTETAFDVYYDVVGGSSWSLGRTVGADETNGTVTGLSAGYTYKFKVIARNSYTSSDSSNEVTQYVGNVFVDTLSATCSVSATLGDIAGYVDTLSATTTLAATELDIAGYTDSLSATTTLTASLADASSLRTDFAYYMGDASGNVYTYSPTYLSDNGTSISSTWRSKTVDFAEQGGENSGLWKTVSKVEVFYRDMTVNTGVTVRLSNDGGVTWTTSTTHYVGSGSNRTDSEDFWFIVSGQFFLIEVIWASTDKEFQFLGCNVEYDETGEAF